MRSLFCTLLAATAVAALPVLADGGRDQDILSAEEIAQRLKPASLPSSGDVVETSRKTRGWSNTKDKATRGIERMPAAGISQSAPAIERPTVSFNIEFAFGSAELKPSAEPQLYEIGAALSRPDLRDLQFVVIGHTDDVGDDDSNLELSARRATAVFSFLTNELRIEPERLYVQGRGEREPLDASQPDAAMNRRVEIVSMQ